MTTKVFDDGRSYEISDEMIRHYFERLTGRIFKIIPIKEEGEFPVQPYLISLLREMLGAKDLMAAIGQDERFMQCINIMDYMAGHEDMEMKALKSEVFHMLNILKKVRKTYMDAKSGGGETDQTEA